MADTMTREQELAEEFKEGLDPVSAINLAQERDSAIAERDALEKELIEGMEALGYVKDGGPEDVSTAGKAVLALTGVRADRDKLRKERDDLAKQVETLTGERDEAKSKVAAAEKSAKAAKASVARGEKSTKPRKIGPMGENNEKSLTGDDLQAALDDARDEGEPIEIVFSDGKQEITGIAPIVVSGEVWREHPRGMMLKQAVPVKGPTEPTGVPYAIAGYGLLIDGKQVAYTARSEPIHVAPGSDIELRDDIWF